MEVVGERSRSDREWSELVERVMEDQERLADVIIKGGRGGGRGVQSSGEDSYRCRTSSGMRGKPPSVCCRNQDIPERRETTAEAKEVERKLGGSHGEKISKNAY